MKTMKKHIMSLLLTVSVLMIGLFSGTVTTQAETLTQEQIAEALALQQQMYEQALAAQAAQAQAAADAAALTAQLQADQAAAALAAQQAALAAPAGMPETYVDVNLTAQTMTYYLNGYAVLASPCVTGNVNAGNGTPAGFYSIKVMVPGKRLVGPTWNVWVNYWMRFTDGSIGLHDASWRSSFGGNIYQTNGSHGCVNLPPDVAATLYSMVTVGTPVVVHY